MSHTVKHTPKQWHLDRQNNTCRIWDNGKLIAEVYEVQDAEIIASSLQMKRSLEEMIDSLEHLVDWALANKQMTKSAASEYRREIKRARTIIAKAEESRSERI